LARNGTSNSGTEIDNFVEEMFLEALAIWASEQAFGAAARF
jgi:hypothetical protein